MSDTNIVSQTAVLAERGGASVAVGGGIWAWLAQNSAAIGAACAISGLVIAVLGFAVNWWYLHRNRGRY